MIDNLRRHTRTSVVIQIGYAVVIVNSREVKKIVKIADIVDISHGGVGILTDYALEKGHVLIFEKEIATNGRKAEVAVVRWTSKVGENKYRVGLKFVTH